MSQKLLPTVLIVLQTAAAIVYATHRDWRHTIYWISAAVLTASVTY